MEFKWHFWIFPGKLASGSGHIQPQWERNMINVLKCKSGLHKCDGTFKPKTWIRIVLVIVCVLFLNAESINIKYAPSKTQVLIKRRKLNVNFKNIGNSIVIFDTYRRKMNDITSFTQVWSLIKMFLSENL